MSIVAKSESDFTPHPEGQFRAVCCDVVDLGLVETTYLGKTKKKHRIRVVFQTEAQREDGAPFTVSNWLTLSMYAESHLRKFLQSWRGKAYTEEEANEGVDVELMIGVGGLIQVGYVTSNGKTYANITSIMRLMPDMEPVGVDPKYVRVKDRETDDSRPPDDGPPVGEPPSDDDLPF